MTDRLGPLERNTIAKMMVISYSKIFAEFATGERYKMDKCCSVHKIKSTKKNYKKLFIASCKPVLLYVVCFAGSSSGFLFF